MKKRQSAPSSILRERERKLRYYRSKLKLEINSVDSPNGQLVAINGHIKAILQGSRGLLDVPVPFSLCYMSNASACTTHDVSSN